MLVHTDMKANMIQFCRCSFFIQIIIAHCYKTRQDKTKQVALFIKDKFSAADTNSKNASMYLPNVKT